MKTRIRKWKRYRARIAAGSLKSASSAGNAESLEQGDLEEMGKLELSSEAISMASDQKGDATPYERYLKTKRLYLILKLIIVVVAVIAMVLLYLFWVMER